jgi:hypothetical protein
MTRLAALLALLVALNACDGHPTSTATSTSPGPSAFQIGGTVSGIARHWPVRR